MEFQKNSTLSLAAYFILFTILSKIARLFQVNPTLNTLLFVFEWSDSVLAYYSSLRPRIIKLITAYN